MNQVRTIAAIGTLPAAARLLAWRATRRIEENRNKLVRVFDAETELQALLHAAPLSNE